MVFQRASAWWSSRLFSLSARAARSTNRTRSWHQAQRRSYASEGDHGSHQKSALSGDLPWAIGSLVVTVPSVWYLAQPQIERLSGKKGSHGGHGHEDEEHKEHGEGSEGVEEDGEESGEKGGEESGDGENEGGNVGEDIKGKEGSSGEKEEADTDSSDSEGGQQDTPDTSDDEGSENVPHELEGGNDVEGVRFKGATSGGTKGGEQGDTRKHIPDAKGGNKKRIESHYGNKQGEATTSEQSPGNEDLAAPSKEPAGFGQQSGKQAGLSNTDTKHSTDIANDPDKSKKSTGGPETAKEQGTVDAGRPAAQTT